MGVLLLVFIVLYRLRGAFWLWVAVFIIFLWFFHVTNPPTFCHTQSLNLLYLPQLTTRWIHAKATMRSVVRFTVHTESPGHTIQATTVNGALALNPAPTSAALREPNAW